MMTMMICYQRQDQNIPYGAGLVVAAAGVGALMNSLSKYQKDLDCHESKCDARAHDAAGLRGGPSPCHCSPLSSLMLHILHTTEQSHAALLGLPACLHA